MKKCVAFLCVLGVMFSGLAWAEEAKNQVKRVAVLPFSVHSSEDIAYVRDGIWDMLISRLSAGDGIRVNAKQEVKEALEKMERKEPTIDDVYGLGKRLDLDYAVWGSITKIGNSISIDAKLLDVSTYKTPVGVFEQCQGMDDVIPRITDFAKKIHYHILGITPPAAEVAALPPTGQVRSPATPLQGPAEGKVIRTKRGTFTSVINPAFMTAANPAAQKGFWMSEKYKKTFKGMDIGDVDGDKKNEVVVVDRNTVMIYQKNEKSFVLRTKLSGKPYDQYLTVDVADINGNGIAEIIVTNFTEGSPNSLVIEFRDGKFETIASGLKWFLRVVNTDEGPVLMGQRLSVMEKYKPFESPIYEIIWKGDAYREGKRMPIPEGLSVFGLTIAKADGDIERIIALDEYDHIDIFQKTKKPLSKIYVIGGSDDLIWSSDDVYGGSNNRIDFNEDQLRAGGSEGPMVDSVYVKERILAYDINGDGRKEIVVIKNLSPSGRIMKNVRVFTSSEIYDLEWDGLGLAENWRTKKIQGYVADYQIKDMDNDGKDEIVLAVGLGASLKRSAIVAYDLEVQQAP